MENISKHTSRFTALIIGLLFSFNAIAANVSVSGSVIFINDPDDVLDLIGWSSVSTGQNFAGEYTIGAPSVSGSTGPGPSLYFAADATAASTIEVFGSGAGSLSSFSNSASQDLTVYIENDGGLSGSTDIYQFIRPIYTGTETLFLNIFLSDSTGSRLSNESFFAETSKFGWDGEGFAITRAVGSGIETVLVGSGSVSAVPVPGALWLFVSSLISISFLKRKMF